MLLYSKWLELPLQTRIKIAEEFGIIKKASIEVFDNKVKNDGYLIKDIESALSIENIQKYLGINETDMIILWDLLISKIEGRAISYQEKEDKPIIKAKRGRPKKNEKF